MEKELKLSVFNPPSLSTWLQSALKELKKEEELSPSQLWQRLSRYTREEITLDPIYSQENTGTLPRIPTELFGKEEYVDMAYCEVLPFEHISLEEIQQSLTKGSELISLYPTSKKTTDSNLNTHIIPLLQELSSKKAQKLKQKIHLRLTWNDYLQIQENQNRWQELHDTELGSYFWGVTGDPLQEWLVQDSFPPQPTTALSEWLFSIQKINTFAPQAYIFEVSAEEFHNYGASAVKEIAFTLAKAHEYTNAIQQAWHPPQMALDWLSRIRFVIPTSHEIYIQIAKLRAFRILWANIQSQYQSTSKTTLQAAFVHSPNAQWNKSMLDQETNILRSAYEAFAAFMGGANSIAIQPYNQLWNRDDSFGRRLARNTALILKKETKLDTVVDPLAGSYAVERLSQELAQKAWNLFQQIEAEGGYVKAWEQGFITEHLQQSREQLEEQIQGQKQILIGVNRFPNTLEQINPPQEIPPHSSNSSQTKGLEPFRVATPFERLRFATEAYCQQGNPRPEFIFLTLDNKPASPEFQKLIDVLLIAGFGPKELPESKHSQEWLQGLSPLPQVVLLQGAPSEKTSWNLQHSEAIFTNFFSLYLIDQEAWNFFKTNEQVAKLKERHQLLDLEHNTFEIVSHIQTKLNITSQDS